MLAVAVPTEALTRYVPEVLDEMDESARLLLEDGELEGDEDVCC